MTTGVPDLSPESESGSLAPGVGGVVTTTIAARSPWQLFWRRLREDKVALVALAFIILLVLAAFVFDDLIRDLVGARGPNEQSTKYLDEFGTPTGPSSENRMGVDPLGRDVFSRVLAGAQVSLTVAIIATTLSMLIGTAVGLLAGFYRGWVDTALSRIIDVLLAFPILLLALGLAAACSLGKGCLGGLIKPGFWVVVFTIAFVNWTYIGRIIRGQVLSLREKEFVEAARAMGAGSGRIIFRHILPNALGTIIVSATLTVSAAILLETSLSYLGLGVQAPDTSLGLLIDAYQSSFATRPWLFWRPALFIVGIALSVNFIGDGLRDAFDPKQTRVRA